MSSLNTITLLFNGLTLALALGFLIISLWHDARKELNRFFAVFLFLVILWNTGSLLALGMSLVDAQSPLIPLAISLMEVGFTGSSIAIYALAAVLAGVHSRRFRWLVFMNLLFVIGYQIFLIVSGTPPPFEPLGDGFFKYRFQSLSALFYLTFDGTALYLTWRYSRKIRSVSLFAGLNLFIVGQSLGFLNPELRVVSLSMNMSALATLVIGFAILKREIITPLAERIIQVEAVHKVSLAITSQIAVDTVLNQIATQAVDWLNADASGIFLLQGSQLVLATVYNLPVSFNRLQLEVRQGVAGTVASTRQSIFLENYGRDWKGEPDLPLAGETFGSVICVPLIYGSETIGVLMVIAGRQGRLFNREDVQLLELLGAQAAVAITHSHLFAEQNALTKQVEAARSQLETVLVSTENPVIAVDRHMRLVFANPAAHQLLRDDNRSGTIITDLLPKDALPNYRSALKALKRDKAFTYEISIGNKVYLCHLAQLGRPEIAGWVAILNDITQLKELDRLKSEMIRMTSHDLKNPLQAAMANLELLGDDLQYDDNPEIHASLDAVTTQLNRMNRIIGGILDLERIKVGHFSRELCQPASLVHDSIEEIQHLADGRHIALTSEIKSDVRNFWGDIEQFKRALINLLENAVKFTPPGGRVCIRVYPEDNDHILFEVEDTGIGIPDSLRDYIFERFVRGAQKGQQGAESVSGTGLGLSLVKTVLENHNGTVWFKSYVGQGTTFYLRVPAAAETQPV
jgi:signal transduction histidine kinase